MYLSQFEKKNSRVSRIVPKSLVHFLIIIIKKITSQIFNKTGSRQIIYQHDL